MRLHIIYYQQIALKPLKLMHFSFESNHFCVAKIIGNFCSQLVSFNQKDSLFSKAPRELTPFLPGIEHSQLYKFKVPSGFLVGLATKPCKILLINMIF